MIKGWPVVPERVAVTAAGPDAEVERGDGVTFGYGADALVVIVEAGDRPGGSAVDNANTLILREPLPGVLSRWIHAKNVAGQPLLGFVRTADGCLALGTLRQAVSRYDGMDPWTGELGVLTYAELTWPERLPHDLLDLVRPTPVLPVPGIEWLADVPRDPVGALRSFVTGWYADVPVPPVAPRPAAMRLPSALLAFHDVAAGREDVLGRQDHLTPLDEIEYEDDEPLVTFAAENQGVWWALIDPTEDDPVVWYDGGPDRLRERERLSRFLLQFAVKEAVSSAPFTGFATVDQRTLDRFVADMAPVPLRPMRVPGDPTRLWVTPGLVVEAADVGEDGIWLNVGSRQRSALRPLRSRLDWERFNG
ncbi:hypothetical protein [Micromonospora zhanjiangensis]|uniref:SMI1 / KNR4 family (SUKH-1) n=1 Tax=Micromonospora zhanjiangensis TaxID=1522057 RepID=A0ABV8KS96_9ACTN